MFGTNKITRQELGDGKSLRVQSTFHTIQGEGPFAGRPAVFLRLAGCNLRCYFCDTDFESRGRELTVDYLVAQIVGMAGFRRERRTDLVVITGGEPLLQNIVPLCRNLCYDHGFDVQIETAGTVWVPGLEPLVNASYVTLVCSPKTGKVHDKVQEYCYDWKYLIQEGCVSPGDGLPIKSTQIQGKDLKLFRPTRIRDTIWLQPCEAYKVEYKQILFQQDKIPDVQEKIDVMPDGEQLLADQEITSSVVDEKQTQRNVRLCAELAMQYNYRVSLQLHKLLGLP